MNSETRACKNCAEDFIIEPDDFFFYEKLKVSPPTWCPECRCIRKMTFINDRSLYKRACGKCDKSTISMFHPEIKTPIWCLACHISDQWDARDYGRDYDFSKPFFEQFKDLKYSIPHRTLDQNERNIDCENSNLCYRCKDVYLSFLTTGSEHIKYSSQALKGNKNCVDCLIIRVNDRGYELVHSDNNFNSSFLVESDQCVESHFLYDSSNCVNCCLSSNLRNKSYVFRNQQLTREEYMKVVANLKLDTYSGQSRAKQEFYDIAQNALHPYARIRGSVNAVGDMIENSKDVYHAYGIKDAQNVKYAFLSANAMSDCQDTVFTGKMTECYEITLGGRQGNHVVLSLACGGGSRNLFYCDNCRGCTDCFGCSFLEKKQYCILNKQYTKEEYEKLVPKVIEHMNTMVYKDKKGREYPFGECFPSELSLFAYNESVAFEEFPLSKEEIISKGYVWREPEAKSYTSTVTSDKLPDGIKDVADTICNEIISCPNDGKIENRCTSAFKILPDELAFYRQMNLPLPRYCPNCRHIERLRWRNPFKFYKRTCMCDISKHGHTGKCVNAFETMYAPTRPEKIYCKDCYQKEVY